MRSELLLWKFRRRRAFADHHDPAQRCTLLRGGYLPPPAERKRTIKSKVCMRALGIFGLLNMSIVKLTGANNLWFVVNIGDTAVFTYEGCP